MSHAGSFLTRRRGDRKIVSWTRIAFRLMFMDVGRNMNRNTFLRMALGTALSRAGQRFCHGQQLPPPSTYTYKTTGTCEVKADVFGAETMRKPVFIWIHGGALIMGSRKGLPGAFHR